MVLFSCNCLFNIIKNFGSFCLSVSISKFTFAIFKLKKAKAFGFELHFYLNILKCNSNVPLSFVMDLANLNDVHHSF